MQQLQIKLVVIGYLSTMTTLDKYREMTPEGVQGDVEHQRIWSKEGLGDLEGIWVLRPLVNYCMPVMRTA
ncbi:MAG: hypothetical protein R2879_13915 [Saprospiraceae bacterium]